MSHPLRHAMLALVIGPGAYWLAARPRRAVGAGVVLGLALAIAIYYPYLQIYVQVDGPGETIQDICDTSLRAALVWLAAWQTWASWGVAAVAIANLACALDLARLAPKS